MRISDWSLDVCSSDLIQADVAVDFGTANMMLGEAGSGILFDEPSVCCFVGHGRRSRLYAAGVDAHAIMERATRSEEHTSELQSLMRSSYAVFCLKKKTTTTTSNQTLATLSSKTVTTNTY